MQSPNPQALAIATQILDLEPKFFELSKRHVGIIHAHSELWCAKQFNLQLPSSGVAQGADAIATKSSPKPFANSERIQIKARGSDETMHISFKHKKIDWLVVVIYNLIKNPVKFDCYLFQIPKLVSLAESFRQNYGEPVIPLRLNDDKIRLEWSVMKKKNTGKVRGSKDTWEERHERAARVLGEGFRYDNGVFLKGIVGSFPSNGLAS